MRSRNTDFQNFLIGLAIQSYTKATILRLTQKKKKKTTILREYCIKEKYLYKHKLKSIFLNIYLIFFIFSQ
jgi:hypothetical protein